MQEVCLSARSGFVGVMDSEGGDLCALPDCEFVLLDVVFDVLFSRTWISKGFIPSTAHNFTHGIQAPLLEKTILGPTQCYVITHLAWTTAHNIY